SQTWLVGTGGKTGTVGVWRTTDAGNTWVNTATDPNWVPGQPLLVSNDGTYVYGLLHNRGLITSTDKGLHWTQTIGYGKIQTVNEEGACGTFLDDGRLVWIAALNYKANTEQLMVSSDYKTFTDFLPPFPVTNMSSPDQMVGVIYSKPGHSLY